MVAGWWKYQRLAVGSRLERKALELGEPSDAVGAADAAHEQIRRGGVQALELVSALLLGAETDDDIARVGAGPLEDLLVDHGAAIVDEVEELARRDPRFAEAMTGVLWSAADAGPEATRRLQRWIPALRR